jgi:hypothetical protein
MTCEQATKELPLLLYDELTFEQEEALHLHLDGCQSCQAALAREKALHEALDRQELPPPADLLTKCRQDLRGRLVSAGPRSWIGRMLDGLAPSFPVGWFRPAGALALLSAGFFAAKVVQFQNPIQAPAEYASLEPVANQVRYVQPDASGNVRVVIDEVRQRVMTGQLEDTRIQQVLLAAARESTDPGLRVVSMDLLKTSSNAPEVRSLFLQAARSDPNPGARLIALKGLKQYAADPEARSVFAAVVLGDDNPGIRIQAIDLLTENREAEDAGVLQELLSRENNKYVRLRCATALREMNASVETF